MDEYFSLIIAVEEYQDKKIPPVRFAENDAKGIYDILKKLNYMEENQIILTSQDTTKTIIESKLRIFTERASNEDKLLIFYAGHGFSKNNCNYLTCYDTQYNDLENTSIKLQDIFEYLKSCGSKRIIFFLDSCESGLPIHDNMRNIFTTMTADELEEFFKASEYCIGFASCKIGQKSYSSPSLEHGIWTYHLLHALNGKVSEILTKDYSLTAINIQSYLLKEVPRTVRHTFIDKRVQVPVLFGQMTGEFIVANLKKVIEAQQIKQQPIKQQLKQILVFSEEIGLVKSLSGFKKTHRIPTYFNNSAENFINTIAKKDIEEEVDEYFYKLRKNLGYKKRDIDASVDDGYGIIITKDFDFNIHVSLNSEELSEVIWYKEITNIRNPDIIMKNEFNKIFDKLFNKLKFEFNSNFDIEKFIEKIENNEPEGISIDYPKDYSECTMIINGFDGKIIVNSRSIQIANSTCESPKVLVESFSKAQKLLVIKHKIKMLPGGLIY